MTGDHKANAGGEESQASEHGMPGTGATESSELAIPNAIANATQESLEAAALGFQYVRQPREVGEEPCGWARDRSVSPPPVD